jgi:HPt (histidine-containing phosphotransfer) domain-containing protein
VSKWLRVTMLAPTATELEESDGYAPVAPLDLARLDDIASDEDEKTEILCDLLRQSRIDLSELETALDAGDIPAMARISHRIKGAARMVGADQLATVFSAMEQDSKQGSVVDADVAVAALTRMVQWLEAHLNETAGETTGEAEQPR